MLHEMEKINRFVCSCHVRIHFHCLLWYRQQYISSIHKYHKVITEELGVCVSVHVLWSEEGMKVEIVGEGEAVYLSEKIAILHLPHIYPH